MSMGWGASKSNYHKSSLAVKHTVRRKNELDKDKMIP